ncbi:MAG TPA: four helix bundle protein [Flavipsychrobacter sp.]|nr:four helix bundle protein [Flavipsychrobacter sp.]
MSEGIKTYRDLLVWQKSVDLVKLVYQIGKRIPESERFGLISQLQRAAVSIPSDIAEGWGRETKNNYVNFLRIAKGSLAELNPLGIIGRDLGYIDSDFFLLLNNKTEEVSRMLNSLIRSLSKQQIATA